MHRGLRSSEMWLKGIVMNNRCFRFKNADFSSLLSSQYVYQCIECCESKCRLYVSAQNGIRKYVMLAVALRLAPIFSSRPKCKQNWQEMCLHLAHIRCLWTMVLVVGYVYLESEGESTSRRVWEHVQRIMNHVEWYIRNSRYLLVFGLWASWLCWNAEHWYTIRNCNR